MSLCAAANPTLAAGSQLLPGSNIWQVAPQLLKPFPKANCGGQFTKILVEKWHTTCTWWSLPPPGRCSRMPPNGRSWQVLTWSWACTTGHPASDQVLEAAANAAWPYAQLCAWTYLNDEDTSHELMDYAIQNATEYIGRHPNATPAKLGARIKSRIRRQAQWLANRQKRERSGGSASDLESIYASEPDIEQRIYASELFAHLSPFAQAIVNRRWHGYSWREIGRDLDMDYSEVRKAYFRELGLLLQNLSRPGDSPKCA